MGDGELMKYPGDTNVEIELANRFTYHAPFGDQQARYFELRAQAESLAHSIVGMTPASREQGIALQKLEEAVFFANAAIARRERPIKAAPPATLDSSAVTAVAEEPVGFPEKRDPTRLPVGDEAPPG